jgi:hypothetical protein
MKPLLFATALTAMLLALSAGAQQGPAGVPGAPGLAPPPPAPPAPAVVMPEPTPGKTNAPQQAIRRQAKGKPGPACPPLKKKAPAACSTTADPARCEQYRRTRELCRKVPESDHRQCLRDNLSRPR